MPCFIAEELETRINSEKGLRAEACDVRSALELISQVIVFAASIGAFGGLWNVLRILIERYANVTIRVSYEAEDGTQVDTEYTKLTRAEAQSFFNKHPPKQDMPVKLIVSE